MFVCVQLSPWWWWWWEKELERPKGAGGDPRKEAEGEREDCQQGCTRSLGCLPSKTRLRVSHLEIEEMYNHRHSKTDISLRLRVSQ